MKGHPKEDLQKGKAKVRINTECNFKKIKKLKIKNKAVHVSEGLLIIAVKLFQKKIFKKKKS